MGASLSKNSTFNLLAVVVICCFPLRAAADTLTPEQGSACAQVPAMAHAQCVQRYTQMNATDAAARRRDENLNPEPSPPSPGPTAVRETAPRAATPAPDMNCNFEGYLSECTHAVDAAVLIFKQSFVNTSEGAKRLALVRATGQCQTVCQEQITLLSEDQGCHTRAGTDHKASRRDKITEILNKCAAPEDAGIPASNASADLSGRRALAEGQTPANAAQTVTPVAAETCVPQSTGVDFCRATGIGTATPVFYYRDATGAVYNTHEAATITRRVMPVLRANPEVEAVRGEDVRSPTAFATGIRLEARRTETSYQLPTAPQAPPPPAPAREPLYSSNGATIPQAVEEAPDYEPQIPASARPTTPQPTAQAPTGEVTTAAATPTAQNPYVRNQPFVVTQQYSREFEIERNGFAPAPNSISASPVNFATGEMPTRSNYSPSEAVSSGSSNESGYQPPSLPSNSTFLSRAPTHEATRNGEVRAQLGSSANRSQGGNMPMLSTGSYSPNSRTVSRRQTDGPGLQTSSSYYSGSRRAQPAFRAKGAPSSKVIANHAAARDCKGDIRCLLKLAGLSGVKYRPARGGPQGQDRELASLRNSNSLGEIGSGTDDILSSIATFHNERFNLDHEGLLEPD